MMHVLALCLALHLARQAGTELSAEIHQHELKAHVYRLASPEFAGRRGAGAARAARYVAEAFERLKLQPAFAGCYFQPIPGLFAKNGQARNNFIGKNVAACLRGCDPKLRDEWIVLAAHLDHLGKNGDRLYPGADDDASGIAMLLEVAEQFALRDRKPQRSILFIAFDQEEAGLLGSRHFANNPCVELRKIKAFLAADMIGRSMANVMDEYVFALGSESSVRLRRLIEEVKPAAGLKVGRIGADIIGTRSDYGPFRDRKIPFLFLSTGQHPDYHRPSDLPERVDYAKLQRISQWISTLSERLANDQEAPAWNDKELAPDLDEVRTILLLMTRVLEKPAVFPVKAKQRETLLDVQKRLQSIVQRGQVTEKERSWLVWTARFLMVSLF